MQAATIGYPGNGPWSTIYSPDIKFEPQWNRLYMAALAAYFKGKSMAHFIWWPWNADGGDTGGVPANDAFFWNQGTPGNPNDPVHRLLPHNGVPWVDVCCFHAHVMMTSNAIGLPTMLLALLPYINVDHHHGILERLLSWEPL